MGNIKALIVGVSQYLIPEVNNLPFCKNDITAIRTAFIHGLTVAPENITICGLRDIVTTSEFIASLQNFE
jgi:hypothetical protein